MRKGEKDFMADVRKKWIWDGWIKDENGTEPKQNYGLLSSKINPSSAYQVWGRVSYIAKITAGINLRANPEKVPEAQKQKACEVAETILQTIYEFLTQEEP